jgi:hypothetical protein
MPLTSYFSGISLDLLLKMVGFLNELQLSRGYHQIPILSGLMLVVKVLLFFCRIVYVTLESPWMVAKIFDHHVFG